MPTGASATPSRGLAEVAASEASLRRFLAGLPGVDQVGAEARAATLATRSIKTTAKATAIDLAIRMIDLTTLEGTDTEGKVRTLVAKALRPDPLDPGCPSVAAVCVYPDRVGLARQALGAASLHVASVATAFPAGRSSLVVKLRDTADAVEAGADEIDMVIDRGAFLSGRAMAVLDEIVAVKQACGRAHLKVILETGELVTYDNVRRAAWLAMLAGADFVKTSTGKSAQSATLDAVETILEAIDVSGRRVGVKVSGGIRLLADARQYLELAERVMDPGWASPATFRFGASGLLDDLLRHTDGSRD